MDTWFERLESRASHKDTSNSSMETALHEACYSGCSLEGLKNIVARHPEAIAMKDRNGLTPLHWALASKMQHSKARALLDYFKYICMASINSKNTTAVQYDGALLTEETLLCTTYLGYTALHHACLSDASSDIIHDIICLCRKSAFAQRHGKTALHMLIEYVRSKHTSMRTASIYTLLNTYPKAAFMTDKRGNTPLHYACYPQTNNDAFKLLLQHSFDALSITNGVGRTPLHCAAGGGAPLPVIDILIKSYPHALTILDIDGNSPLHLACQEKASPLVKSRLLVGDGERMLLVENGRRKTPLQLCEEMGDIYALLRLVPHYMQ